MKMKDISQGRSEIYKIDPRIIEIDPQYNVRQELKDIPELAQSIKANGVKIPMSVRIEGDRVILVRGHRRLAAVNLLIEEGLEIDTVPCSSEKMGQEDRILDLILSNDGQQLNPLEQGEVFKQLVNFGWSQVKIAEKTGKTQPQISSYLKLVDAPVVAKQAIINGTMSASLVLSIINENQTEKKIEAAINNAEEKRVLTGSKKVTKKAIAEKKDIERAEIQLVIDSLKDLDLSDIVKAIVGNHLKLLNKVAKD